MWNFDELKSIVKTLKGDVCIFVDAKQRPEGDLFASCCAMFNGIRLNNNVVRVFNNIENDLDKIIFLYDNVIIMQCVKDTAYTIQCNQHGHMLDVKFGIPKDKFENEDYFTDYKAMGFE